MTFQTNTIPPERLAQIASRRLAALGIPHHLQPDRQSIEGVFTFSPGRVVHPVTGLPLGRSRFLVVGHDRLRFTEAPLSVLEPVPFYEARSPLEVEGTIAAALQSRGEWMKRVGAKFESLKLKVQLDPDALVVRGWLDTHDCRFELEGGVSGVRVRRILEQGKPPAELPEDAARLDLNEFPSGVDLELHLSDQLASYRAAAMRPQRAASGTVEARAPVVLELSRPPVGTPTLDQLARGFGVGAVVVPGPRLEVAQEFIAGGMHYRFVAQHEAGNTFRARLLGPRGVHWQDRIDLARFPGSLTFVASVLGIPAEGAAQNGSAPESASAPEPQTSTVPESAPTSNPLLIAHPGEIWVMAVVIEQQEGDEVRYACIDVNGRPFGATRVLRRSDFERVFVPHGAGWRLLIRIERIEGETVFYRQLNSERQPSPEERKLAAGVLISTFVPEAAAY